MLQSQLTINFSHCQTGEGHQLKGRVLEAAAAGTLRSSTEAEVLSEIKRTAAAGMTTGAATGSGGEIRDEGATGRGSKPKAGLVGFTVSNLRIPPLRSAGRLVTVEHRQRFYRRKASRRTRGVCAQDPPRMTRSAPSFVHSNRSRPT